MTADGLESLVAPNCSQCLVPMEIAGAPGRPYWRCDQRGTTSVVGAVPVATASPLKRTDLGGIDRAWQGFEAAIEALDVSELHPQIRIGPAVVRNGGRATDPGDPDTVILLGNGWNFGPSSQRLTDSQ